MNRPHQPHPYIQPYPINQSKCKVFIENLDQCIQDDYLYKKFREQCGLIIALNIQKDKSTGKSKGKAVITFSQPEAAREAITHFNGQVLVANTIRVKPYHIHSERQANLYISNLDEKVTVNQLEEVFSEFGNILSAEIKVHKHTKKSLGYGYVQFESKEVVDKLFRRIQLQPIILENREIKIEIFKNQRERQQETKNLYFRAFAETIPINNNTFLKAYEYGWKLQIEDYFQSNGTQVNSVFVKFNENLNHIWAIVGFNDPKDAQEVYSECNQSAAHRCFKSNVQRVWELIQQSGPLLGVDGSTEFTLESVKPFFDELRQSKDLYQGDTGSFFYNYADSKHKDFDPRLLFIKNLQPAITVPELETFMRYITFLHESKFGKVIQITIKSGPQTNQGYVQMQTERDARQALTDIYNIPKRDDALQMFIRRNPFISIFIPQTIRNELREIKNRSRNSRVKTTSKLLPQHNPLNFTTTPPQIHPLYNQSQPFQKIKKEEGIRTQRNKTQKTAPSQPKFMYQQKKDITQQQQPSTNSQTNSGLQTSATPFTNYGDVKKNMANFVKQPSGIQRMQLGSILNVLVQESLELRGRSNQTQVARITGMLIDEKLFEIADILSFLENDEELQERIQEGLELIDEEEGTP